MHTCDCGRSRRTEADVSAVRVLHTLKTPEQAVQQRRDGRQSYWHEVCFPTSTSPNFVPGGTV